jgi:outer membrane protein assembly factor BamB
VANGVVYLGSADNNVYALDASTGALLWSYPTGADNAVGSSPAVANGVVYVSAGGGNMYAFGLPDGDQSKPDAASKRPDPEMPHPDSSLKGARMVAK